MTKKQRTSEEIMIDHEHRLTRLEVLMYFVAGTSALNFLGVKVFDGVSLFPWRP